MSPQATPDLTLEGLVHDLNNVFETMSEAADLLSKDPKYARLAATLRRSVEHGHRILGSYFESSMASLEFEAILDNAIEFARISLEAVRGPQIEFTRELEAGVRLRGSPAAWERVLVNLFLNAAQAMPEGGRVEVAARRTGEGVEITVSDSGPGISARILPQIFEPRFSTRAKRSGLGLHIVQTLVRENGGDVAAANRHPGPGAIFTIRLPGVAASD